MVVARDPAVERRRLRVELRKLRLEAGLTQSDVVKAMEWSTSKLIRIENGDVSISVNDLKVLLAYYGISDNQVRVNELLESARTAKQQPWSEFRDVHSPAFLTYLGYESSAATILEWEPLLVPGLLQTEEYSLAQQLGVSKHSEADAHKRWEGRERRQELIERDNPPKMHFILYEAALWPAMGGPGTMREQLKRVKELSELTNVTVQVVPFTAGAHRGMKGPFILLEFDDPNLDDLLYLEHSGGEVVTRDDTKVTSEYIERWADLRDEAALSPRASRDLIDRVIQVHDKAAKSASTPPDDTSPPGSPTKRRRTPDTDSD